MTKKILVVVDMQNDYDKCSIYKEHEDAVCITKQEYEELLEIKAKYGWLEK